VSLLLALKIIVLNINFDIFHRNLTICLRKADNTNQPTFPFNKSEGVSNPLVFAPFIPKSVIKTELPICRQEVLLKDYFL
jgi:hypothetical protein